MGRGHFVEFRAAELQIIRVSAVDRFGFGFFSVSRRTFRPREEFEQAVLAVVA